MVGVDQWVEIRRLVLVERRSQRQVAKSLGLARDTVARALASDAPPRYERAPAVSKVDPFKEWICEQLLADPSIQSLRLREMAAELVVRLRGLGDRPEPTAHPRPPSAFSTVRR